LFPAGIIDPDDLHNFKFLEYRGIRFDLVLLAMIDEVNRRVPLETERFLLHGVAEIRKVPIQLVVGDLDVEGWEINNPNDSNWLPGLEKQGKTRIERLQTLQKNLDDHGIATRFDLVPGAAHQGLKMIDVVCEFFASVLARPS